MTYILVNPNFILEDGLRIVQVETETWPIAHPYEWIEIEGTTRVPASYNKETKIVTEYEEQRNPVEPKTLLGVEEF